LLLSNENLCCEFSPINCYFRWQSWRNFRKRCIGLITFLTIIYTLNRRKRAHVFQTDVSPKWPSIRPIDLQILHVSVGNLRYDKVYLQKLWFDFVYKLSTFKVKIGLYKNSIFALCLYISMQMANALLHSICIGLGYRPILVRSRSCLTSAILKNNLLAYRDLIVCTLHAYDSGQRVLGLYKYSDWMDVSLS